MPCMLLVVCALFMTASLFSSCSHYKLITLCIETRHNYKHALDKYPEQTPLTVAQLKAMLLDDTTHYKVVTFYSPCCGPCLEHLSRTYPEYMKSVDTTDVRFYYIADDCGSLKHNISTMQGINYYLPVYYYLRDSTESFSSSNGQRWTNIANYLFAGQKEMSGMTGIPVDFIISKDGKVKQCYVDEYGVRTLETTHLWTIGMTPLRDLDYDAIDTLYVNESGMRYCNTKNCRQWQIHHDQ